MRVLDATRGNESPLCISASTRASFFPSFPPGCRFAKSSSLKPRRSESATASASPRASIVVVDAVGASPNEHASFATEQSSAMSAASAKVESFWLARPPESSAQIKSPVMLINGTCSRLMVASSRRISSVSPLADKTTTTSPRTTIPRSPCTASTGCMKSAGVPIELNVAAILRAMIPLLPIPVTTTRPLHASIIFTAPSKAPAIGPAMRSASARRASASMRTTFSPVCFMKKEDVIKIPGVRRAIAGSEVVVDDVDLSEALRLDHAIPRAALPVVFPDLDAQPRRDRKHQPLRQCLAIRLVKRAQLSQFLIRRFILFQSHTGFGQMLAQVLQSFIGEPLLASRIIRSVYDLCQVHDRMASHCKRQFCLLFGDAIDPGEYEGSDVQHRRQRGEPRLIAMLRAEETQHRIRNVTGKQIGRPPLPAAKDVVEHNRVRTASQTRQQFAGRRRRSGTRIEQRDLHLTRRERRIDYGQIADDHAQEGESHSRFHDRERTRQRR